MTYMGETLLISMPQKSKMISKFIPLTFLYHKAQRVHNGVLDLPTYVTGNLINLCDIKVVYHVPPLDIIPSLFCKGTIGWKKTFWLAL